MKSASVETACSWVSRLFGVMTMSGLRYFRVHLASQDVEVLRRRGRVTDLHVLLGAELQKALESSA